MARKMSRFRQGMGLKVVRETQHASYVRDGKSGPYAAYVIATITKPC